MSVTESLSNKVLSIREKADGDVNLKKYIGQLSNLLEDEKKVKQPNKANLNFIRSQIRTIKQEQKIADKERAGNTKGSSKVKRSLLKRGGAGGRMMMPQEYSKRTLYKPKTN